MASTSRIFVSNLLFTVTVLKVEKVDSRFAVVIVPIDLKFDTVENPEIFTFPPTSKVAVGNVDPIPTL